MGKTTLAIDGHVHLYPVFDLVDGIESGIKNLIKNARKKVKSDNKIIPVWLLVERSDASYFDELKSNPEKFNKNGFKFKPLQDGLTIGVEKDGETVLYMFAGRQLVTSENLEVLSLVCDLNIADKEKPIAEVVQSVKKNNGIPTLNWAPGKWFFGRGKVINEQIENNAAEAFFIGETTLRNTLWPKPSLIKKAEKKDFRVIAGSDPLPFGGEEQGIGAFGFTLEGDFDENQPAASVRKLLNDSKKPVSLIGKRNGIFKFAIRQYKIMGEKKTREQ